MKYLMIVLMLATANVSADIRSMCESRWPGDYVMQEYCIDKQKSAYRRMNRRTSTSNMVQPGSCSVERQHVVDIAGAGLMGTAQYEKAKAAVKKCIG